MNQTPLRLPVALSTLPVILVSNKSPPRPVTKDAASLMVSVSIYLRRSEDSTKCDRRRICRFVGLRTNAIFYHLLGCLVIVRLLLKFFILFGACFCYFTRIFCGIKTNSADSDQTPQWRRLTRVITVCLDNIRLEFE